MPLHELVHAAHLGDQLVAGAEVEVVGIGEHRRCAKLFKLAWRQCFDRRLRADGREDGGLQGSVPGDEGARPRVTFGGLNGEAEEFLSHGSDYITRQAARPRKWFAGTMP